MIESMIVAAIVLTAGWFSFKTFRKAAANDGGCAGSCGCSSSSPAHISKFADMAGDESDCGCGCGCGSQEEAKKENEIASSGGCGCGCGCN